MSRSSNKRALTLTNGIKANIDLKIISDIFGVPIDTPTVILEREVFNAIYKRHPFPTAFVVSFPSDAIEEDGTTYVGITGEQPFMESVFGIKPKIGIVPLPGKLAPEPNPLAVPPSWNQGRVDPTYVANEAFLADHAVVEIADYLAPEFQDLFET